MDFWRKPMIINEVFEHYLENLLHGDRKACRSVIEQVLQTGTPAITVYLDVIWPVMVEIEKLLRDEKITATQEHLATRINRTLVDQLQNKLPCKPCRNKKIVICCAEQELQELGAQMMADLFESDGWETKFLGGGLTNEDIMGYTSDYDPDVLLIYGSTPKQAPSIRQLIDTIKAVNARPNMKIMVSGGLFNRAEGLWEEIGADLFAATAVEALQVASTGMSNSQTEEQTPVRRKKIRKKTSEEQQ
jgi:MerR family transcriptional regulator, light-induced transcriptional regulator